MKREVLRAWGAAALALGVTGFGLEATVGLESDRAQSRLMHPSAISDKEGKAARQRLDEMEAELVKRGFKQDFDGIRQIATNPDVIKTREVAAEWKSVKAARAQSVGELNGARIPRVLVEVLAALGGVIFLAPRRRQA